MREFNWVLMFYVSIGGNVIQDRSSNSGEMRCYLILMFRKWG